MNHFGLFSPKYTLHKIKCHTIFSQNFHYNKTELQNQIMINPRVKRFPVFVYLEWKLTHISLWKIMIYVTGSFFFLLLPLPKTAFCLRANPVPNTCVAATVSASLSDDVSLIHLQDESVCQFWLFRWD